jgi:hypothetical protein
MVQTKIDKVREVCDRLRDKVESLATEAKLTNENVKAWYDDFLGRVTSQNKDIMEETERVRGRVITVESANIGLVEKVSKIFQK